MDESEVLDRSLGATLSLLELPMRRLYEEEVLRILRHDSLDVPHFDDTISTLEKCRV